MLTGKKDGGGVSDNNTINPNGRLEEDFFSIDSDLTVLLQFDDVSAIGPDGHRFRARRNSGEALDWIIHGLKTNNQNKKKMVLSKRGNRTATLKENTSPPASKRQK